MGIGRTLKQALVSTCIVAVYGAFNVGCSVETSETDASRAPSSSAEAAKADSAGTRKIPASSTTKEEYGVDTWTVETNTDVTTVTGVDEDGATLLRFERTFVKDGDGTIHGEIQADVDGAPKFQFVISPEGEGTVTRNDFPKNLRAVDTALAALADFQRDDARGVQTDGLTTSDLSTGDPNLVTGRPDLATSCLPVLGAVVCIIAASCGLGGDAGASVMAAVVEAGVSQECSG